MKQYIYADNAATTKLDSDALKAMLPWLTDDFGNASQPYFFGKKAQRALLEARKSIAECINALPEEIYFTSGGSESDNWALKCFGFSPTDVLNIYTSEIEHHAVLNTCKMITNAGRGSVYYLPVTSEGVVSPEYLSSAFEVNNGNPVTSCEVGLVSVMFANNEIGTIQPIKELAKIAHQHGAYFHTDAVQAVGHIKIDVKELGVDMLSASAHKFNGPKGTGFLYIRKGTPIIPLHNGGMQENNMRAGTEDVASIVGMALALKKNCEEIEDNGEKMFELESVLMEGLSELDIVRNGAKNHIPGNISLSFKNKDGEALLHRLDLMGICVSTGSACDSVNTQISHVLKAIKLPEEYAKGTIRISLGKNNTEKECKLIIDAIKKIIVR